jgi:hypothetical protein
MDKERLNDNKKLAEWVGFRLIDSQWHLLNYECEAEQTNCDCLDGCYLGSYPILDEPPDFFTDENVNAMLLDKMPEPELLVESMKTEARLWGCTPDLMQKPDPDELGYIVAFAHDRKEAIARAALKWIKFLEINK